MGEPRPGREGEGAGEDVRSPGTPAGVLRFGLADAARRGGRRGSIKCEG